MRETIVVPPIPQHDPAKEALEALTVCGSNPFTYDQLCKLMGIRPLPPEDPRDRTR